MDSDRTIRTIAGLRMAVGASGWVTPTLTARAYGLDARANRQAPYLARLVGIRDFALGLGPLTSSGEPRRRWLRLGILCDAADATAALLANRGGYMSKLRTVFVTSGALAAVGLGAAALAADGGGATV